MTAAASAVAFAQDNPQDSVARILQSHPRIEAARQAIVEARAHGLERSAEFRPMASLNGYFAEGDGMMIYSSTVPPVNNALLPPDAVAMGNVMLMWKVWAAGRDFLVRESTDSRVKAAREMVMAVRKDVALDLVRAIAENRYRLGVLKALRADFLAAEAAEANAIEMEAEGTVPRAFVLRAAAETRRTIMAIAKADGELDAARASLSRAAGTDSIAVETLELNLGEVPKTLDAALEASRGREELTFLEYMAKTQGIDAEIIRRSEKPEVSLMAMGRTMETSSAGSGSEFKVGFVFSMPIVDGGMRAAKREILEAKRAELSAQYTDMLLVVQEQVRSAWSHYKAADEVLDSATAWLESAKESYRVEQLRFESGTSTMAELIDAQAMLLEAQVGLLDAERYLAVAKAGLQRTVGDMPNDFVRDEDQH